MDADLPSARPPLRPRPFLRWSWRLIRDLVREYSDDGVGDLAASITFWTILSIPAAVLALVSTLSSLESIVGTSVADRVQNEVQRFVADTFTDSGPLNDTIADLFDTKSRGVATVATLVAVFTLSRAFAGIIRALNIAYEVDDARPFWYQRIVAIGLGLATIVIVAAGATVLAVLPSLPGAFAYRWLIVPGVLLALVLWATTLFHLAPNHRTPWRYDLPGAVVTALGWAATTQGFALYVRLTAGANDVQSSIGAVLLALTLMYLLGVMLIVGAELNDILARRAGVVHRRTPVTTYARRARRMVTSRIPRNTDR